MTTETTNTTSLLIRDAKGKMRRNPNYIKESKPAPLPTPKPEPTPTPEPKPLGSPGTPDPTPKPAPQSKPSPAPAPPVDPNAPIDFNALMDEMVIVKPPQAKEGEENTTGEDGEPTDQATETKEIPTTPPSEKEMLGARMAYGTIDLSLRELLKLFGINIERFSEEEKADMITTLGDVIQYYQWEGKIHPLFPALIAFGFGYGPKIAAGIKEKKAKKQPKPTTTTATETLEGTGETQKIVVESE